MSEENSFLFAEYAKPKAKIGKNRQKRILLIIAYLLFAAGYALFFTAITLPQVIALLPLFVWMLVYFTWGAVSYECCVRVASGKVSLLKLRGKKEKELFSFEAKKLLYALPYNEEGKKKIAEACVTQTLDLRADEKRDGYAALLPTDRGVMLLRFECSVAVATAMRYYNKNVSVDKDFLTV